MLTTLPRLVPTMTRPSMTAGALGVPVTANVHSSARVVTSMAWTLRSSLVTYMTPATKPALGDWLAPMRLVQTSEPVEASTT